MHLTDYRDISARRTQRWVTGLATAQYSIWLLAAEFNIVPLLQLTLTPFEIILMAVAALSLPIVAWQALQDNLLDYDTIEFVLRNYTMEDASHEQDHEHVLILPFPKVSLKDENKWGKLNDTMLITMPRDNYDQAHWVHYDAAEGEFIETQLRIIGFTGDEARIMRYAIASRMSLWKERLQHIQPGPHYEFRERLSKSFEQMLPDSIIFPSSFIELVQRLSNMNTAESKTDEDTNTFPPIIRYIDEGTEPPETASTTAPLGYTYVSRTAIASEEHPSTSSPETNLASTTQVPTQAQAEGKNENISIEALKKLLHVVETATEKPSDRTNPPTSNIFQNHLAQDQAPLDQPATP